MKTGALYLAQMCATAYGNYKGPTRHLPRLVWCYKTSEYVELRRMGQCGILIFRGTNDIIDWMRNADHHLVSIESGAVHNGFLRGWEDFQPQIEYQLRQRAFSHIVCTGHSRGGALAQLCHDYLKRHHPELVTSCVTFGCPRLGDTDFYYEHQSSDIVNYVAGYWPFLRDPVPMLPPCQFRPGTDIVLPCWGRPTRMHSMDNYIKQVSK